MLPLPLPYKTGPPTILGDEGASAAGPKLGASASDDKRRRNIGGMNGGAGGGAGPGGPLGVKSYTFATAFQYSIEKMASWSENGWKR